MLQLLDPPAAARGRGRSTPARAGRPEVRRARSPWPRRGARSRGAQGIRAQRAGCVGWLICSPPAQRASRPSGPRLAGHQLDLERRLVHEQVVAGHQRPPCVDRRGRQRRRPRVVEHLEHHARPRRRRPPGRRSGPRRGSWRPARRPRRRAPRDGVRRPGAPAGGGATAAKVSSARAGSRTSRVADRQPRSASARRTEAAVAPPPSTVAEASEPSYRSVSAAAAPGTSVLCPLLRPPSRTTVFAAPACSALGRDLVEQRHHGALERHGQRQPAPGLVEPVEERGEGALADLHRVVLPVQPQLGVGRPVQHRGQRVPDRAAEDGTTSSHRISSCPTGSGSTPCTRS